MNAPADPRMTKARSSLIMLQPFFGALALHLRLVEDASVTDTMATDGEAIFYSPTFLDEELNERTTMGVVAHEVAHCAYRHHTRRENRDPELWNIAADYVINADLIRAGFELPKGALLDPQYDGLSTEEIYSILAKKNPPSSKKKSGGKGGGQAQPGGSSAGQGAAGDQGQDDAQGQAQGGDAAGGQGQGGRKPIPDPGRCGGVMDAAQSPATMGEEDAKWEARVRQALNVAAAHNAGSIPGALQRLAKVTKEPRHDWRDTLRRFIDDRARFDYSWTQPNKRHLSSGMIFPGVVADGLSHLGIVIDTSGSIDNDALAKFGGELQAAVDQGAAARVTVIYCDTRVHNVSEFQAGEDIQLIGGGGGGTRFSPALDWFEQNASDVSALIYFTDLECHDFGREPACPLLWAAYGDPRRLNNAVERVPFGEVIKLED
jgi:predicted metal-dependent peptidase